MSSDQPLSEATIPSSLAEIQRRCADLLNDDDELTGLSLLDTSDGQDANPYDSTPR